MNTYKDQEDRQIAEFAIEYQVLHQLLNLSEDAVIQSATVEVDEIDQQNIRLLMTRPDLPFMQEGEVILRISLEIKITKYGYETTFE